MKRLYLKKNVRVCVVVNYGIFELCNRISSRKRKSFRNRFRVFEKFREPVPLSIFFCLG